MMKRRTLLMGLAAALAGTDASAGNAERQEKIETTQTEIAGYRARLASIPFQNAELASARSAQAGVLDHVVKFALAQPDINQKYGYMASLSRTVREMGDMLRVGERNGTTSIWQAVFVDTNQELQRYVDNNRIPIPEGLRLGATRAATPSAPSL